MLAAYSVYPRAGSTPSLYFYQTNQERSQDIYSVYIGRVGLQEALQTMMFTFVFLVLTYDPQFVKTSRALKALVMIHVLYMVYVFSLGSGACFNPAIAFGETIYWVIIAAADNVDSDAGLIWVYMLFPMIGAAMAAMLYGIYEPISAQFSKPSA
jgi:glycerol uptake facilitator-like aquaporin